MDDESHMLDIFSNRLELRNSQKKNIAIGIYGSFHRTRKNDLLALRSFLRDQGYDKTRISLDMIHHMAEDHSSLVPETLPEGPIQDMILSDLLVKESTIHIFIFVKEHDDEHYLIQSVSMEFQHIRDCISYGAKKDQFVAVYVENGLEEIAGGVFKGQIMRNEHGFDIAFFNRIEEIFKPVQRFCDRSLESYYR
ncbi:hypothetical protein [Methanocalculus sp.]|uniref:hypothetical protein n=1 Tax=Methanocalculus sp. TaxID=2004547 RepID=UPI00262D1CF9|nr:hypothetical protein [Methanocalculus sp.]MDG6251567.1 hypothetical protein [Methanocalculus sp.]